MGKKIIRFKRIAIWISVFTIIFNGILFANKKLSKDFSIKKIRETVQMLMEKGDIPGLTLVIVRPDRPDLVESFGYANVEKKINVTPDTRFELASCSKSFTALAALKLESEGLLNFNNPVSKYLPWFNLKFDGKPVEITVRHALHHITGIPWNSIEKIPMGNEKDALEQTIKNIVGMELDYFPGKHYEYATVNYDIIGLIIEKVSGMSYEEYMKKHIFNPLELISTQVGMDWEKESALQENATGYKIGFFKPREYDAPSYKGNSPAGYIVSNGKDMVRWLKLQLGMIDNPMSPLIQKSHQRDELVPLDRRTMTAYTLGWQLSLTGDGEIRHSGLNPNYTSYIVFRPKENTGVAVLANSNSNMTNFIGRTVMDNLHGIKMVKALIPGGGIDGTTSVISIVLCIVLFIIFVYILSIFFDLIKHRREVRKINIKTLGKIFVAIPIGAPFLLGIYILPLVIADVSWKFALVWTPVSFKTTVILLLITLAAGFLSYILSTMFPQKNKYLKSIPVLIILSMLSGGANAVIIFLISGSLFSQVELLYMLYYFALAMGLYLLGRKVVQTKLTELTFDIVFDMRMKLLEKVFYTSYERFEKLDGGRIFATLNDDTGQVGNSAGIFVTLLTSIITTVGVFLYLATVAFWATMVTLLVILAIASIYYVVSQKARVLLEEARDTRNDYMRLLNGLIDGFKELSIHFKKKKEYHKDLEIVTNDFRKKTTVGIVKFINAFMVGESLLIAVLGSVAFAVPRLFPHIQTWTLMSFIMALLYLIGPVNGILHSIPQITQLKIAWGRVQSFIKDIPANMKPEDVESLKTDMKEVKSIEAKGVMFEYESKGEEEPFKLGPIDFEAKKGEIVFVVGGNGSGKTTLAKMLTGLYIPHEGTITIDGQEITNYQLGEYFSTVFSGYHLFEKLYNIDLNNEAKRKEGEKYLETLNLHEKVCLETDSFSTINLSGGQRKRLALLQCYLEDCPIYLFDEVAADQDPEFRRFFYRDLLMRMKERGKIVIAITHDDHYFDVADKVIKLDMGKVDVLTEGCQYMLSEGNN